MINSSRLCFTVTTCFIFITVHTIQFRFILESHNSNNYTLEYKPTPTNNNNQNNKKKNKRKRNHMKAHGWMVTSSHQIAEVMQCRARLVLGWVTAAESRCRPCVEVLGKPLISRRLCPPSSDGYLVERESWIVMTGFSCSKIRKCWILPRGDETVKECVPIPGV